MEQTITVSQLTFYIKKIFEAEELLFNISVVGEVSGIKLVRGILYFDLKDENSMISCVCFNGNDYAGVKNGDKIIAKGTPGFYVKGGKLNFNVCKISPFGLGELYKQFLELKEKLLKEGLFDESHKIAIPTNTQKIGVITSQTGAVFHDIMNVATRRNPAINLVLYPAKVQGEGSSKTIIEGLKFFEEKDDVDVVIIARGGGSAEDLMEFNDEALARQIYVCKKPIVSAVGHETDFTICDFVSDVRAPTPSAAAELSVPNIFEHKQNFLHKVMVLKSRLENLMFDYENGLINTNSTLLQQISNILQTTEYQLNLKKAQLEKFNPNKILAMGYAKVESEDGQVITSTNQLKTGDKITISLKDGKKKGEIL